jgi:2-succinyl-6-hydroxy-2,4-cyclohexadiene-1-carboxylate synthase
MESQLGLLEQALDNVPEPFVYMGHSMGGFLGVRYALRHPRKLCGLVLESTAADNPFQTGFKRANTFLLRQAELAESEGMLAVCDLLEKVAPLHARQRKNLLSHTPLAYAETLHAIGRMERVGDRLGEIHCPTLVIAGYQDEFFVESSKQLVEKIPGAEGCFLSEVGHSPHRDAVEKVAEVLMRFLGEYAGGPRG